MPGGDNDVVASRPPGTGQSEERRTRPLCCL